MESSVITKQNFNTQEKELTQKSTPENDKKQLSKKIEIIELLKALVNKKVKMF